MWFCSGQAGAKFTPFPWLRAARGTPHCQRILRFDYHAYTMRDKSTTSWSIVTIALPPRITLRFATIYLSTPRVLTRINPGLTMLVQKPNIVIERVIAFLLFQVP